jgi:hypothetical protein
LIVFLSSQSNHNSTSHSFVFLSN